MKNRLTVLLLTLCLFLPLAAFSEGSEVSCRAGDTIEVIFSPVSDADMPDMLVGHLEYDHDAFELVPGQLNTTPQDGLYIYGGSPAKVSFRVSRFTPDGTYEISLKVLDAAGSGAEQVTVPPVRVTVGSSRAASSETVAVLSVSGYCGDNAFWDYQDGTLTIYGKGATYDYADAAQAPWHDCRNSITHIVINNGITSIGQFHFYSCTALTSVSLPNSLKVIGPAAFEACATLAEIRLPDHLEDIREYAFYNCSGLTDAEIPGNVWRIGDSAFRNCSSLQEIKLPESITSIGPSAFRGCERAAALTLSPRMTMIPYDCFDGCSSLTTVTIPSSVTAIGYRAFEDCQALTSVIIPESVAAIDVSMVEHEEKNSAFSGCSKLSIWCLEGSEAQTYAKNNNIPIVIQDGKCGENLYWKLDGAELVICGSGGMDDFDTDKTPWASYKASIQSLHVCEGVTKIGRNAFYECALSHIDFPQSLKVIRYRSFLNNRSLTDVVFPEGLEEIHQDAFSNCKNLKSIIFPSTLKSISGMAFQNIAIETVALPDSIQNISGNPFCCCVNLSAFALGNSAYFQLIDNVLYSKDGKEMISYPLASDAKKYTVKPGTEIIVPYAFYGAQNLKEVIIPEGVTRLGLYNFFYNDVIEKIYLPMSLNTIEEGAFSKCDNLTVYCYEDSHAHTYAQQNNVPFVLVGGKCGENANWIYNDGVLIIEGKGDISGYNWQNLEARPWHSFSSSIHSIIIRSGITRIGESCFESFTALTSVSIPNTVNYLAYRSFLNCSSLTHISLPNTLIGIAGASFYDCKSLTEIDIPDSVTWLGFGVFRNCVSLTRVHLSKQLTGISYLEFDGCKKLAEIEIPGSVTFIGHNAFSNCPLLTTIIIPPSVTQIDVTTHDEESFDPTFYQSQNITIYCYKDSAAHTYALENNIPFVLLPTFN